MIRAVPCGEALGKSLAAVQPESEGLRIEPRWRASEATLLGAGTAVSRSAPVGVANTLVEAAVAALVVAVGGDVAARAVRVAPRPPRSSTGTSGVAALGVALDTHRTALAAPAVPRRLRHRWLAAFCWISSCKRVAAAVGSGGAEAPRRRDGSSMASPTASNPVERGGASSRSSLSRSWLPRPSLPRPSYASALSSWPLRMPEDTCVVEGQSRANNG